LSASAFFWKGCTHTDTHRRNHNHMQRQGRWQPWRAGTCMPRDRASLNIPRAQNARRALPRPRARRNSAAANHATQCVQWWRRWRGAARRDTGHF
jgi:hypothetical protein